MDDAKNDAMHDAIAAKLADHRCSDVDRGVWIAFRAMLPERLPMTEPEAAVPKPAKLSKVKQLKADAEE